MSEPASFRELIDVTFQGRERFATETGIDIKHVDVMKHRDSIAPDHWSAVVAASERLSLGIDMAMLAELRARRKAQRIAARASQSGEVAA